ncbi:hypothetical protein GGI11_005312 [Coemansia sp. RSA 2049]|nr:hypothetical protein GGI11_005312 [Coemansia sp. RSA 2049]
MGALFSNDAVRGFNVFVFLFIWLVLVGICVGGNHPLAATIISEYIDKRSRGKMMATVFAFQGLGNVSASIVATVVLACFKSAIQSDVYTPDYTRRRQLVTEALHEPETESLLAKPACIKAGETESAQTASANPQHICETGEGAVCEKQTTRKLTEELFLQYFGQWSHLKVLPGTSLAWFAVDVAFYGINLNSSVVTSSIGFSGNVQKDDPYRVLMCNCLGNIIINLLGSIPGYICAVFTIERLGRKPIQLFGFAAQGRLISIKNHVRPNAFIPHLIEVLALFTLADFFVTFWIPETRGKTLEDIESEA